MTTNHACTKRTGTEGRTNKDPHQRGRVLPALAAAGLSLGVLLGGCTSDGQADTDLFGTIFGAVMASDKGTSRFAESFNSGFNAARERMKP